MREEIVQETEDIIIYKTDFSETLERGAKQHFIHPLKDLKVRVIESKKNGAKDYILANKAGEIIYASSNFETVAYKIDVLAKLVSERAISPTTFKRP